jgi:predicted DsbA family dithiol-disulfide isomerase
VPLASYLPDAGAMLGYVRTFAQGFGIYDLRPPERLPNTRRAHAAAQLAREHGRLDDFRAAAFDAYWCEGRGLETDAELRDIARTAGVDEARAVAAASDPAFLARVDAARRMARAAGVTGIPTFELIPDAAAGPRASPARIVGCQPLEVLVEAARRAGATRRRAS